MASLTQWTWVWASSRRWWRTEKSAVHGVAQSLAWLSIWTTWMRWKAGGLRNCTLICISIRIYDISDISINVYKLTLGTWKGHSFQLCLYSIVLTSSDISKSMQLRWKLLNRWISMAYLSMCACVCAQWCLTLCDPMGYALPGASVMEFSRQEYWSRFPFPTPGDLPDRGIEHVSSALSAPAGGFFITEPPFPPKILPFLSFLCPFWSRFNFTTWYVFFSTRRNFTVE